MSDVTRILSQIEAGDPSAAEQLLPLVYDELRKLAAAKLAHEKPGQTLQATALVHEAYLRLVGRRDAAGQNPEAGSQRSNDSAIPTNSVQRPQTPGLAFNDRTHFFRAAAEAMRRILVDQARRKQAEKHGGGVVRVELADLRGRDTLDLEDVVAVNDALARFEQHDPDKAELVKLRFFAGLTSDEAARLLGISSATAERHWAYARAWLYRDLSRQAAIQEPQIRPKNV